MNSAESFYIANKDFKPKFPPVPAHISTDEDLVRWLFKEDIPFIDIDLEINADQWAEEAIRAIPFLVPHREKDSTGWNSCCIHGIGIDKTGVWNNYLDSEPEYNWTELSNITPVIKKFWEEMPFEKFARIRFMELEPHGLVLPHNDSPPGFSKNFNLLDSLLPINIAIIHPNECYMTLKDHGVIPWKVGNIRLINITNDHSVINFSGQRRIHMIGHGLIGNRFKEFCKLIARSYRKQYERYRI